MRVTSVAVNLNEIWHMSERCDPIDAFDYQKIHNFYLTKIDRYCCERYLDQNNLSSDTIYYQNFIYPELMKFLDVF